MATIVIIHGSDAGKRFDLGSETTIGRDALCEVRLNVGSVSRRHARIRKGSDGFYVEDLNSTNGTFVNGKRIDRPTKLQNKDRMYIHETPLAFLENSGDQTSLSGIDEAEEMVKDRTKARAPSVVGTVDATSDSRIVRNAQEKFRASLTMIRSVGQSLDAKEILDRILDDLFEIFPQADCGYILLKEKSGALTTHAMKTDGGTNAAITIGPVDQGLAERVLEKGEAVLCVDEEDESESVLDAPVRTMMCAPLMSPLGQPLGVIYIDTKDEKKRFAEDDVELLTSVSIVAGMGVEFARQHRAKIEQHEANQREMEREIARRKTIEAELRRFDARLTLALESGGIGTWDWDMRTNAISWDKYMRPLFGLQPGTVVDRYEDVIELIHPDDRDRVAREVAGAVEHDQKYRSDFRVIWPDRSLHYLAARGSVQRDAKGEPIRFTGVCWDMTERRQLEQDIRLKDADLERFNEEIEQFAYVASHDLQEPLRAVVGFTQLLHDEYHEQLDDTARDYVGQAVAGAKRMESLINDLLEFSRVGSRGKPFQPVACNTVFDEVVANLEPTIDKNGAQVSRGNLPEVLGDHLQLVSLAQHLIANAIKYRRSETPRIEVHVERRPQDWLFAVRDNGMGLEKEHYERIFVIFQRLHTRDKYPGTGIGLAICKRIVQRHRGRIWVESKPGEGSVFFFTIPRSSSE